MSNLLKKDGIYIVMLAGMAAIWIAMACSIPDAATASKKIKHRPKQDVMEMVETGKCSTGLAVFLVTLCAAGCGLGLVTDIILYLKRKVRQARESESSGAEVVMPRSAPWELSDIFRFAVIFVFLVSCIQGAAHAVLAYQWISPGAVETGALVAGTLGIYVAMLWLMYRILIKGYDADLSCLGISLRRFFWNAWSGIVGYIAFIPAFFLLLMASLFVCQLFGIKPQAHELVEIFSVEKSPYTLAYLIILAIGLAPVYEEIVFRGFIYGVLRKYAGVQGGMALSALFFAAIHFNFAQLIPVWGLGMMLAYLYEKTGTLTAPIVFHAINNGIAVSITLIWLKSV